MSFFISISKVDKTSRTYSHLLPEKIVNYAYSSGIGKNYQASSFALICFSQTADNKDRGLLDQKFAIATDALFFVLSPFGLCFSVFVFLYSRALLKLTKGFS